METKVFPHRYKLGHVIVTEVICEDIIEVGVIEKIVVRGDKIWFLVALHECARDRFNVFQALPVNKGKMLHFSSFQDFKPLIMRGAGECFRFVLHHHLPCKHVSE